MRDLKRLREFTKDCRPDMHEPDEQGISAKFGPRKNRGLDNACTGENQDMGFWLINSDTKKREWFNLANIIALARRADSDLGL